MMDRKGAVGLVVGIVMFAMVASVAMGIDFSRTYLTRVRLQTAIDAAALTAGREVKASTRDADATLVFWQNFAVNHVANGIGPLGSQTPGPKITFVDASTLNISATAYVPMVFAKIFGWNQIPVVAQAQVVAAGAGLRSLLCWIIRTHWVRTVFWLLERAQPIWSKRCMGTVQQRQPHGFLLCRLVAR